MHRRDYGHGKGHGYGYGAGIGYGYRYRHVYRREYGHGKGYGYRGMCMGRGHPLTPPHPVPPDPHPAGSPWPTRGWGSCGGCPPALQRLLAAPRQLRWLDLPVNRLTAQPAPGQGGTSGASRPPGATRRDVPPPSIPHL